MVTGGVRIYAHLQKPARGRRQHRHPKALSGQAEQPFEVSFLFRSDAVRLAPLSAVRLAQQRCKPGAEKSKQPRRSEGRARGYGRRDPKTTSGLAWEQLSKEPSQQESQRVERGQAREARSYEIKTAELIEILPGAPQCHTAAPQRALHFSRC